MSSPSPTRTAPPPKTKTKMRIWSKSKARPIQLIAYLLSSQQTSNCHNDILTSQCPLKRHQKLIMFNKPHFRQQMRENQVSTFLTSKLLSKATKSIKFSPALYSQLINLSFSLPSIHRFTKLTSWCRCSKCARQTWTTWFLRAKTT